MELWIRSQDGKLLTQVKSIGIYQNHFGKGFDIGYGFTTYATYKKEARALQVLDEIQNILQPIVIFHEPIQANDYHDMIDAYSNDMALQITQKVETELKESGQFVYQMPKE